MHCIARMTAILLLNLGRTRIWSFYLELENQWTDLARCNIVIMFNVWLCMMPTNIKVHNIACNSTWAPYRLVQLLGLINYFCCRLFAASIAINLPPKLYVEHRDQFNSPLQHRSIVRPALLNVFSRNLPLRVFAPGHAGCTKAVVRGWDCLHIPEPCKKQQYFACITKLNNLDKFT